MPEVLYETTTICPSIVCEHFLIHDELFRFDKSNGSYQKWTGKQWNSVYPNGPLDSNWIPLGSKNKSVYFATGKHSFRVARSTWNGQSFEESVIGTVNTNLIYREKGGEDFLVVDRRDDTIDLLSEGGGMLRKQANESYKSNLISSQGTITSGNPRMLLRGVFYKECIYSYSWVGTKDHRFQLQFSKFHIHKQTNDQVLTEVTSKVKPTDKENNTTRWEVKDTKLYCVLLGIHLFEVDILSFENNDPSLIRYCTMHDAFGHRVKGVNSRGQILVSAVKDATQECFVIYVTLEKPSQKIQPEKIDNSESLRQTISNLERELNQAISDLAKAKKQKAEDEKSIKLLTQSVNDLRTNNEKQKAINATLQTDVQTTSARLSLFECKRAELIQAVNQWARC